MSSLDTPVQENHGNTGESPLEGQDAQEAGTRDTRKDKENVVCLILKRDWLRGHYGCLQP